MTKEQLNQLKYDFDCKIDTVYRFLDMFALINGERAVYIALERYLDDRNYAIVPFYDKKK